MEPTSSNVYADDERARSYSLLEFPGTYGLAFRDLPELFARHVTGRRAVDFGCGTGRSSRFLRGLGFTVIGVDVSAAMLERARSIDPAGDYRLVPDGDLGIAGNGAHDLVLSAFPFDNIPADRKEVVLRAMRGLLAAGGRIVNLVSAAEIYWHEWVSFTTEDFPENRTARSGEGVRIVMLDVPDRRPVQDVLCTAEDYCELYARTGLRLLETHRPLATGKEDVAWKSEITVSPWAIHVLCADAP